MANIRNTGTVIGRLTKDPVVFDNSDGSKKVMITVAVKDNFKTHDEYGTQFVQLQAFVSNKKDGLGVYGFMEKGSMVGIEYSVRTNNYTAADGTPRYEQILFIEGVDLMESKSDASARKARAAAAGTPVEAEAVPAE